MTRQSTRLLGRLLSQLKRYEPALRALDASLERGRAVAELQITRGLVRAATGDLSGAIDDYSRALAANPKSSELYAKRGWLYVLSGAPKIAIGDFDHAVKLDKNNADAYLGRGFVRAQLLKVEAAVGDAETALRIGPRNDRTLYGARASTRRRQVGSTYWH